jgi:2-polyprenyl-3-methyl-5-hydroxy-6-metoxy-1,4-benzoquinol methylase
MDLKEADILGARIAEHWYYKSKAAAMMRLLGSARPTRVLDVGAGSGFFSRRILSLTDAEEAWCVDISYTSDSDTRENGKPIHFRRKIERVDADLVLLMDVLEHVDEDVALLRHYVGRASPNARFMISVPAFQLLWSGHDEFLEHKRRYTLAQIEGVATAAGLELERGAYYFGAVLPLATITRLAERLRSGAPRAPGSQLRLHHPVVNWALSVLCSAELPVIPINRFAGLTAFCVARKP